MEQEELLELRTEIDRIDRDIMNSLARRAQCALKIGQHKQSQGLPAFDACREREVVAALRDQNTGPLSDEALANIFTEIISACRSIQAKTVVAYLGPEATFSHMAAVKHFGRSAQFLPCDSIPEVFRVVERGHADFGVVPVENSTEGAVGQTLDQLAVSEVGICGEVFYRISHALMSRQEGLGHIAVVYSHPQALAQCLGWLSSKLPGRPMVPAASTSAAAVKAAEEPGAAAVGNEVLASIHGLSVLARDIQDYAVNETRFLILGGGESRATDRDKTSLFFATSHQPGALRAALTPFSERGINLTRIESRPAKDRPWEYVFFVDIEGHGSHGRVQAAMNELAGSVRKLKVLGSYPAGDPLDGASSRTRGEQPALADELVTDAVTDTGSGTEAADSRSTGQAIRTLAVS